MNAGDGEVALWQADSGADTAFAWVKPARLAPQMPTGKALRRTSAIATARGINPQRQAL